MFLRAHSSAGRASVLYTLGPWFESRWAHMEKIIIVGCPGSGKTTLANILGKKLNIPVHHLDKYYWKDNWQAITQEEFSEIQRVITSGDRWIIDGNYSRTIENRMLYADTIIFFDFPSYVIYWRVFKRYIKNFGKQRKDMGGNNKESLKWDFIKFIYNFHSRSREIYALLEKYKMKKQIVFKSPRDVLLFLANFDIYT